MTTDYVAKPDLRLLVILSGLAAHYGKTYCFPSYDKILILLAKRFAGRPMSKRTLARHLGALVQQLYLKRVKRHQRERTKRGGHNGRLILRSTLYHVYPRARAMLRGFVASIFKGGAVDNDGVFAVPILAANGKSLLRLSFKPAPA